jgi:predicted transposase YdaD
MTEQELNAVLDGLDEEFRALPPSPYRDYLIRWGKRQGRKEGRQEGRQEALLNVAANLMSPAEVERLSTLTLDALRELVERELAALTCNRTSDGAR